MADIVLGLATSHTPMLTLPAELWPSYARSDERNPELAFPPHGARDVLQGRARLDRTGGARATTAAPSPIAAQSEACQRALDELSSTLRAVNPDVTIDHRRRPGRVVLRGQHAGPVGLLGRHGAADPPRDAAGLARRGGRSRPSGAATATCRWTCRWPARFGRYLIEYLIEHDFDVAHMRYVKQPYGGRVARRYPTRQGELDYVRETPPREQGLPHALRLRRQAPLRQQAERDPSRLPEHVLPAEPADAAPLLRDRRGHRGGGGRVERAGPSVAIIASGGLSHFVVDEELDRGLLGALERNDAAALRSIPRHRLHSAGSEVAELGRARGRHADGAAQDGAARLRARVSHARRDRRRLGLRALAVARRRQCAAVRSGARRAASTI